MSARRRSAGMALFIVIFLIVALVGLGAAVASLSSVEHDTESKSLLAAKAYWGARAGLEWGINRAAAPSTPVCLASQAFTLTDTVLNGVNVTVQCTASTFGTGTVYSIASTATIGTVGTLGYAERRLRTSVSQIP